MRSRIGPQDVLDGALGQRGQRAVVVGRFDDDFVRADAVHAVEQAFAFAVQVAFDAQRRKLVGHDAHAPAGRVRPAAVAAIGQDFRRRLALVAVAERAEALPVIFTLSRTKSVGRLARSVEMMTQRPVMGSLRSSGTAILPVLYYITSAANSTSCSATAPSCRVCQCNAARAGLRSGSSEPAKPNR